MRSWHRWERQRQLTGGHEGLQRRTPAGAESPDLDFIGENRRAEHTGSGRVGVLLQPETAATLEAR
jgi:hypothetical protein